MPKVPYTNSYIEQWKKDETAPFHGWDFSYIRERHHLDEPDWNYEEIARQHISKATSVLDIGTGGGEMFARLAPFPRQTIAVEDWHPNVMVARKRLSPLGVTVLEVDYSQRLPFQDGAFDLILNRHSALPISELSRILRPGGVFITQQVDGHNLEDLAQEFGAQQRWPDNSLRHVLSELEHMGCKVIDSKNWTGTAVFNDVGAIVYFLRNIPWIVDGFRVSSHLSYLEKLQQKVDSGMPLRYTIGRFFIQAEKVR